jgi:hypothetical protein
MIFGQLKRIIQQQQFLNNFSQKSNLNHKYLKINNGQERTIPEIELQNYSYY